ncbi:MAG: M23 family metallopeptidase [Bacteroidales bacterium]
MNKKILFLTVALTVSLTLSSQNAREKLFLSPLKEVPSLSASFAELRNDHFHSGLDYRTGGVTGKEVLAASDGYVYRIAVSPSGFGKAVYIRHPSGYSTVYAHLKSFRPDIEEYVKKKQYELRSFSVSLFPARDQFKVLRGELIAWSGNSGGSTGPHLHFEIRDSSTEETLNPLNFDMGISDRTRPVIEKIILYPVTRQSSVNKRHASLSMKAVSSNGSYTLPNSVIPAIYGQTGIGLKCWDNLDNSSNKCGIYSIELLVDSIKVYCFTADRFSFNESRYLNSHIDYPAKIADNEYIHKLFIQPGNRLSMYSCRVNSGVLNFSDSLEHNLIIIVRDAAGNKSTASFRVRSLSEAPVSPLEITCSKIIPYGKASDFTADGIRIHFPAGALYDTLFFVHDVKSSIRTFLSPIHSVHNKYVAVHDRYRLSIRPDTVITGKEEKMCLAVLDEKGNPSYSGGDLRYGYVSGDVGILGDFVVSIDTVPPQIKPSFASGANLTGKQVFTVTITDDFSGIKNYETWIDGQWVLAEYDAKNNLLIYRPEAPVLKENALHHMELSVTDDRGNKSILKTEFKW